MNSSAPGPGGFHLFSQTSLSMLQQTMQSYAAAAAAGSFRQTGMPGPGYYLHGGAIPQLRLPQTTAPATGSILNARLLGAPPPPQSQPPSQLSDATRPMPTPSRQDVVDQQALRNLAASVAAQLQTGELVETTLEGKSIFAFDVAGEKRLCLPQVLNKVLLCAGATLADINRVCEDLNIFCDRCNSQQMGVLKERKVFGPVLDSCGLITKSNAERLCKALLNSELPKYQGDLTGEDGISVYHSCFGKQRGFLIPRLYTSPDASCIVCNGCSAQLSPSQFVGHAHSRPERDTCHWGFDSTKWRLYLLLDKRLTDSPADGCLADSERACLEKVLDSVKAKFDRKRPQTSGNHCPDAVKRCRTEAASSDEAAPSTSVASVVPKFLAPLPPPPAVTAGCSTMPGLPQLKQAASVLLNPDCVVVPRPGQRGSSEHRDYAPNVRLAPAPRTGTPQKAAAAGDGRAAAAIEESIASDWESLTDWGEGHLPEKATPQFLAMVEKVKSGYRAHVDCLNGQAARLRAQVARTDQAESEAARLRRQLEEQGSPDVRRLRMKYTAQKEELRQLEAEKSRLLLALSAALARPAAGDHDDDGVAATGAEEAGPPGAAEVAAEAGAGGRSSPPSLELQALRKQ